MNVIKIILLNLFEMNWHVTGLNNQQWCGLCWIFGFFCTDFLASYLANELTIHTAIKFMLVCFEVKSCQLNSSYMFWMPFYRVAI